jgi:hypothetical protein
MGENKIRICTGRIKLGSHNQGISIAIITEEKEAGGGGKGAPLLGVNAPDADLTVIERRLLRRELLLRAAAATHRTERPDPEPETRERLAGEEEGDKPQGFGSSQIKRVVFLASPLDPLSGPTVQGRPSIILINGLNLESNNAAKPQSPRFIWEHQINGAEDSSSQKGIEQKLTRSLHTYGRIV